MVLCQFFLSGNCRFGTKCYNEHIDLKQLIRNEIDSAIKGNQWPVSCFGPFKDKPCIPNFIEDQSFEEIRFKFYEAKVNGNFEQVRLGFMNLIQDSKNKLQQLNMLSPEIMNIFVQLYNSGSDQKKDNQGGQTSTIGANTFAQPAASQAQNIFGKSNFAGAAEQSAASIFGSAATNQPSTNIFGSNSFAPANQPSPGIFGGQTQQQPQQSIFGGPQQNATSIFGQSANTFQSANTGSQFALPQVGGQPQQSSHSIFGSAQTPQTGFPGLQNTFQPSQPTQSVFAQANQNQSALGVGQPGIFGQQQQPIQAQASNIFQTQQTPYDGFSGSVFAQTQPPGDPNAAQMRNNVFNQQPQQPTSIFGSQQTVTQSPFQQPLPHVQQQQQQSAPQQQTQSPFGGQQQAQQPVQGQPALGYYDKCYSKMENLSPEDLEAFKAEQFEAGKIPTAPPPKELCF